MKIKITDNDLTNSKTLHSELEIIDKSVFKICGFELTNVETEAESQEYFAHNFQLDGQNIKFRTAKITPTKIGQFVTIWKRNEKGITEPFDISDNFEFYIIATRQNEKFGLFIFPKTVLYENRILSDKTRDGKRGIRVYPTWDLTINKQAQKTQLWQTKYFLDISPDKEIDLTKAKNLLSLDK
ncbi:MepB family protein [Kaistella haifensis]|uniref:MepB family protein n=1 Tax=Kaistella haifensis TaxID=421525 RepID=UPI002936F144|nr:MepB family protein [Kaistella haifensis]